MNALFASAESLSQKPVIAWPTAEDLLLRVELQMNDLLSEGPADLTVRMARDQLESGGKRMRARLALHACACFGVEDEHAVAWAAAVEILHNATLVHDDVQDGDTVRRGKPTIWARYGQAQAINAGDFLLMLPFLAIKRVPSACQGQLAQLIAEYATRTVRGQVDEIEQNAQFDTNLDAFLTACAGKTGALLALPVVGAAILGGMSSSDAQRFSLPFVQLGVLFQLQDDVVDLFGDKGRNQLGGDIYEGKVSALLVELLRLEPERREEVTRRLQLPRAQTTELDVNFMKELYLESGALRAVLSRIFRMRDQVLDSTLLRSEPRLLLIAEHLVQMALKPIIEILEGES